MSMADAARLLVGLPPLIDDRSVVLVLGSFPSKMSLAKREYYGNPQNHFWPMMETLFGIDRQAPYTSRTSALLDHRIAVWDVIAECNREGSGDDAITEADPNPIMRLLKDFPGIRSIAFNGGTASRTARLFVPDLFEQGEVQCERLPSSSPRNARMPLVVKVDAWRRITEWLAERP